MVETESKYAESLISQDVINQLMKEAEDLGPDALMQESPRPENNDADDAGDDVISQDDIDDLLNGGAKGEETESEEPELISQEDIDALLEGNVKKTESTPTKENDGDEDTTDLDLVTPEDIEKLLSVDPASDPVAPAVAESGDDFDQISEDDIDALLSGSELNGGDGDDILQGEDADDSLISQEDIDALLSASLNTESPSEAETSAEEKEPIIPAAEADAPAAEADAPAAEADAPAVETEAPVVEAEAPAAEADTPDDETRVADRENDDDGLISQDDINRLLAGDDDSQDSSEDDGDTNLISQDDIDNLIKGHIEDDEESEEETLITQEDIDKLLKMPEPEGFSESADEEPSDEMEQLVSQEDIDKLLNADFDEIDTDLGEPIHEDTSDQVILEKSMDSIDDTGDKDKPKRNIRRIVVSCVAAALVLIVTGVSWMMFSGHSKDVVEEVPVVEVVPEEEPDVPEDVAPVVREYVAVIMNDFVVPAPASMKGTAYIYLNMTIEIADVSSNPIKDYEPFFRNIIYEVLNKALVLQSDSRIVEADLKRMIKEALNDSLSEGSIAKIDFSEFKLG